MTDLVIYWIALLLLLESATDVFCFEDLVIERRPHHVDWEDLFMEYNRYSAPDRENQQINVTIEFIKYQNDVVLFEMNQKWRDERLRFVGSFRAPVPSHIHPWVPDTYIRNGFDTKVEQSSLSLNYDGTFLLREKYQTSIGETSMSEPPTIIIASLNNYGANLIRYNINYWKMLPTFGNWNSLLVKNIGRKFDSLHFEDAVLTLESRNDTDSG